MTPLAPPRDPIEELYGRPGFLLRRAHQIAVGLFVEMAGGGFTTTQYGALVVLRACDGLDQIGLSKRLGIDRSTSALVVGKLEAAGYLRRSEDVRDLRRKELVVTPEGARALDDLAEPAAKARLALLNALTPVEGERLFALLERFARAFNASARASIVADEDGRPAPPRLASLYVRPGFLLRRAHQISVTLFLSEAEGLGVTTTQYGVLVILRHREGLDQRGLSKTVGLDRTTTALVVRKLESKGLVVRVPDAADRRRKVIVLTGRGERTLEALRAPAARARERALSVFDRDEAQAFTALTAKLVAFFNRRTRAPLMHAADEVDVALELA